MTQWRQGVVTQLGRDGAGVLVDRESGVVFGFSVALMGSASREGLTDGTLVQFLVGARGEVVLVETRSSLLALAEGLTPSPVAETAPIR